MSLTSQNHFRAVMNLLTFCCLLVFTLPGILYTSCHWTVAASLSLLFLVPSGQWEPSGV